MNDQTVADVVGRALAEDVGSGDVTTAATVEPDARARALITQKAPGVVFGLDVAQATFRALDDGLEFTRLTAEGAWRDGGPVLRVEGSARAILTGERSALNFLGRLSGVATLTARCVQAVEGTGAQILDTRKTTPGLRALEKAAVAAGGGTNHRAGLFDAILIKENHAALAGGGGAAGRQARPGAPELALEGGARAAEGVGEGLGAGANRILLDNMSPAELREAVAAAPGSGRGPGLGAARGVHPS